MVRKGVRHSLIWMCECLKIPTEASCLVDCGCGLLKARWRLIRKIIEFQVLSRAVLLAVFSLDLLSLSLPSSACNDADALREGQVRV